MISWKEIKQNAQVVKLQEENEQLQVSIAQAEADVAAEKRAARKAAADKLRESEKTLELTQQRYDELVTRYTSQLKEI